MRLFAAESAESKVFKACERILWWLGLERPAYGSIPREYKHDATLAIWFHEAEKVGFTWRPKIAR